ncbi:MAG TPA: hypothetical protein VMT91_00740 [Anaerolineales bacterium]|nr:hypothetical protein [Anaerolineales bacterium]
MSKKVLAGAGIFLILFLALMQLVLAQLVLARPLTQASNGGLSLQNAIIDEKVYPGEVLVHRMMVSNQTGAPPRDLQVEIAGFGQGLDGGFIPLPADQDVSPYSARSFITAISNPSFHLEPGKSVEVDATITIPQNLGTDTRYAMIYIHTPMTGDISGGNVGQILGISVPVILTPQNAVLNPIGVIDQAQVAPVVSGQPITIETYLKNTGNRHFKVTARAVITDSSGAQVTEIDFPATATSLFPTFRRLITFTYSSLDNPQGLKVGKYQVDVKVLHADDGSLVDEKQLSFEITQPYAPFAGVDLYTVSTTCFNNQVPGTVDATAKADTKIIFEGTGAVTGCVAVVKYPQEPALKVPFEANLSKGGMAATGVKFIGINVTGFNQGLAHVEIYYHPGELPGGMSTDSLFLATLVNPNSFWSKLGALEVQSGAQLVKGDIDVANLVNGNTVALGGTKSLSLAGALPYIGGCLIALGLLAFLILMVMRQRQKNEKKLKRTK